MRHQLISTQEIASLPDDPEAAFVQFEAICRERLIEITRNMSQDESEADVHLDYMSRIVAAAREFGISELEHLKVPSQASYSFGAYSDFTRQVVGAITGSQIRASRRQKKATLEIDSSFKAKLRGKIGKLKSEIESSDLDDHLKSKLFNKLAEFERELSETRLDLAKTLAILASISTIIAGSSTAIARFPEALHVIFEMVDDAATRAENAPQLPHSPKLIEDKASARAIAGNPDDDVPF